MTGRDITAPLLAAAPPKAWRHVHTITNRVGRPSLQCRPRRVPDQGQGRQSVAADTKSKARDLEEGRQARPGRQGELRLSCAALAA